MAAQLMLAAYHGHADLVRFLVQHGADPNRLNDRQQSPLAGAVFKKEDNVIEVSREEECLLEKNSANAFWRDCEAFICVNCQTQPNLTELHVNRLFSTAGLTQITAHPPPSSASPCLSRRTGGERDSSPRQAGGRLYPAAVNDIRFIETRDRRSM
jgi:hypothetical protein